MLDDPDMHLWQQYAVHAWPTLVLIDPAGYVVAQAAGEGQAGALGVLIDSLIAEFDARGELRRGDGPYVAPPAVGGDLRFPAKAIVLPGDSLLVADAGHNQLVELPLTRARCCGASVRVRAAVGRAGRRGHRSPSRAGWRCCRRGLAPFDVVVADTANHVLRGVRLADGAVVATIDLSVGLADARTITGRGADRSLAVGCGLVAGAATGRRRLRRRAPAGRLVAGAEAGRRSWPAPRSRGSRTGRRSMAGWRSRPGWRSTVTGSGSSTPRPRRCAHCRPTAAAYLRRRRACSTSGWSTGRPPRPACSIRSASRCSTTDSIAIADTYNGAIRRYDPKTDQVSTLATGLDEPSGLVVSAMRCWWSSPARTASLRLPLDDGQRWSTAAEPDGGRLGRSPSWGPGRSSSRSCSPCRPVASSTRARGRRPGRRSAPRRRRCWSPGGGGTPSLQRAAGPGRGRGRAQRHRAGRDLRRRRVAEPGLLSQPAGLGRSGADQSRARRTLELHAARCMLG